MTKLAEERWTWIGQPLRGARYRSPAVSIRELCVFATLFSQCKSAVPAALDVLQHVTGLSRSWEHTYRLVARLFEIAKTRQELHPK